MIVEVKKLELVILKKDEEQVLKALQHLGEVMVISNPDTSSSFDSTREDILVSRAKKSLSIISGYKEKESIVKKLSNTTEIAYNDFIQPNYEDSETSINKIEKAEEEINKLKASNEALKETNKSLAPWSNLEGRLSTIKESKSIIVHTGFVPLKTIEEFKANVEALECDVEYLGSTNTEQAVMIASWYSVDETNMEKLKTLSFNEVELVSVDKEVKEIINDNEMMIKKNNDEIHVQEDILKACSKDETKLKIFADQMLNAKAYKNVPVQNTKETVYLEGWIKSSKIDRIIKEVSKITDCFDYQVVEPTEEEDAPVALENNKFATNFEPITDMFDHPSRDDLDPNPMMSLWYWMIFGLMMADAGYGLVLALGSLAILKVMKPKGNFAKLIKVFFLGSITTLIWGIVFGSYFGAELIPHIWFVPQEDPVTMLLFSLVIGVVHLSCGLIMKFILCCKQHHVLDGIFDCLSWTLVLIGGTLALTQFGANMLTTQPVIPQGIITAGYIIAGVGLVIILFTAGRSAKNIIMKGLGGLKGLYNITSYLSDVLSYARILALAMSSAIIGYVMNLLAGMVGGGLPVIGIVFQIIIYIIGHIFNLAMGLLSAYVHASRLQYIEFYGKFYSGGGKVFAPLTLEYNYLTKVNE